MVSPRRLFFVVSLIGCLGDPGVAQARVNREAVDDSTLAARPEWSIWVDGVNLVDGENLEVVLTGPDHHRDARRRTDRDGEYRQGSQVRGVEGRLAGAWGSTTGNFERGIVFTSYYYRTAFDLVPLSGSYTVKVKARRAAMVRVRVLDAIGNPAASDSVAVPAGKAKEWKLEWSADSTGNACCVTVGRPR